MRGGRRRVFLEYLYSAWSTEYSKSPTQTGTMAARQQEQEVEEGMLTPKVSRAINVALMCLGVVSALWGSLVPGMTMDYRIALWIVAGVAFLSGAVFFCCDLHSAKMMQPALDVESAGELRSAPTPKRSSRTSSSVIGNALSGPLSSGPGCA